MKGIENKYWIGWAITIFLSISGAWGAMTTRAYNVEKEIAVVKQRIEVVEKSYDRLINAQERQVKQYNDIKESLIRIEENLKTKQDKFK